MRAKPYTHTETLPKPARGVKLPRNYEPAYFRKRKTLAVLRAADHSHYLVFDLSTGRSIQVNGTRAASQTMSDIRTGKLAL